MLEKASSIARERRKRPENGSTGLRSMSARVKDRINACLQGVKKEITLRKLAAAIKGNGSEASNFAIIQRLARSRGAMAFAGLGASILTLAPNLTNSPSAYAQEMEKEMKGGEWSTPECFGFEQFVGQAPCYVQDNEDGTYAVVISAYEGWPTDMDGYDLYETTTDLTTWSSPAPLTDLNTEENEIDYTKFPDNRKAVLSVIDGYPFTPTLLFDGQEIIIEEEYIDRVSHSIDGNYLYVSYFGTGIGGENAGRIPLSDLSTHEQFPIDDRDSEEDPTETINPLTGEKQLVLTTDKNGNHQIHFYTEDGSGGWQSPVKFEHANWFYHTLAPNFNYDADGNAIGTIMFFAARASSQSDVLKICWTERSGIIDEDGDGVPAETDCDDENPDIIDATDGTCDGDLDGHIDDTAMTNGGGDCDDEDPNVNPNADEVCTNSIDDDCDGATDYDDTECTHPDDIDDDGDGQTENQGDCNDGDPTTYTGAPEYCDTTDHNCDGHPTNGAVDASEWYRDQDGDDYGDPNNSQKACEQPLGYVADNTDCDDGSDSVYPGAPEVCGDDVDQDCSGADLSCADVDNDGDGWTENQGDCDDENAAVNPEAEEVCDEVDNNCKDGIDEGLTFDNDSDGYTATGSCEGSADDCNDEDPTINPDADEIPGNVIDENCDDDLGPPEEEDGGTAVWVVDGLTFEIDPETGNVTFPEGEGEAVVNTNSTIEFQLPQGQGILSGISGFAPGTPTTASLTWEGMNLTYENIGEAPAELIFEQTKLECEQQKP